MKDFNFNSKDKLVRVFAQFLEKSIKETKEHKYLPDYEKKLSAESHHSDIIRALTEKSPNLTLEEIKPVTNALLQYTNPNSVFEYNENKVKRTTLTVKEFADYLGISVDHGYKLCRENEVPHVRVGSRILLNKDSIDKWFEEKEKMVEIE